MASLPAQVRRARTGKVMLVCWYVIGCALIPVYGPALDRLFG